MSLKKYRLSLTEAEHEGLARWSKSQHHSERERKRARILLLADEAKEGGADKDAAIAAQVRVCLPTVSRVRQRFAERVGCAALTCLRAGQPVRQDSEYVRNGTASLFYNGPIN